MQRIDFKNSRKLNLSGTLYKADSDAIVIMAHGFVSDKTSSGRFDYIAQCLNLSKYNVLTFDFSGYGESDNDSLTCAKQIDDLNDDEELLLKEIAEKAMHYLPPSSCHKVINGAGHNFWRHLDKIVNLGISWLEKHMPV